MKQHVPPIWRPQKAPWPTGFRALAREFPGRPQKEIRTALQLSCGLLGQGATDAAVMRATRMVLRNYPKPSAQANS